MIKAGKLGNIEALRGVAALSVCLCHFSAALSGPIQSFLQTYGALGVQSFFVISGFVIPRSLAGSGYTIRHFGTFLTKRAARLHPPYLAALALTTAITWFSYRVRGQYFPETWLSVAQSAVYLHLPADNPVFWTLAIEVQYYVFIGLVFPLFDKRPWVLIYILIPIVLGLGCLRFGAIPKLFSYMECFFMGVVAFLLEGRKVSLRLCAPLMAGLFAWACLNQGLGAAVVAFATAVTILTWKGSIPRFAAMLGAISYSLYLIHFPIGVKFINLSARFLPVEYRWLLFFLATVVAIAAAGLLYYAVEIPAMRISSGIKFRGRTLKEMELSKLCPAIEVKS